MARRRRHGQPLWVVLPMWALAVAFIGWGGWQAILLRRNLLAQIGQNGGGLMAGDGESIARSEKEVAATQPAVAVESMAVVAEGAQGGEPWKTISMGPDAAGTVDLVNRNFAEPIRPDEKEVDVLMDRGRVDVEMPAEELMARGMAMLDGGQIVAGRAALNGALARSTDEGQANKLRETLTALNGSIFLGTAILPEDGAAKIVELRPGDSFLKLGRAYGVPAAFLELINPSVNANNMKPLTGVKVVQGPFHVRVIKHASRMDLYARDIYVKSFAVEFPGGNYLPRGDYEVAAGTKLQIGSKTWIGFTGAERGTDEVTSGWMFGSAGPRAGRERNGMTGIYLADGELQQLYNVLAESRSHIHVEP